MLSTMFAVLNAAMALACTTLKEIERGRVRMRERELQTPAKAMKIKVRKMSVNSKAMGSIPIRANLSILV